MDIEWINFIHSTFHIRNAPYGRIDRANHIEVFGEFVTFFSLFVVSAPVTNPAPSDVPNRLVSRLGIILTLFLDLRSHLVGGTDCTDHTNHPVWSTTISEIIDQNPSSGTYSAL